MGAGLAAGGGLHCGVGVAIWAEPLPTGGEGREGGLHRAGDGAVAVVGGEERSIWSPSGGGDVAVVELSRVLGSGAYCGLREVELGGGVAWVGANSMAGGGPGGGPREGRWGAGVERRVGGEACFVGKESGAA